MNSPPHGSTGVQAIIQDGFSILLHLISENESWGVSGEEKGLLVRAGPLAQRCLLLQFYHAMSMANACRPPMASCRRRILARSIVHSFGATRQTSLKSTSIIEIR
jgi:hypothetical protein